MVSSEAPQTSSQLTAPCSSPTLSHSGYESGYWPLPSFTFSKQHYPTNYPHLSLEMLRRILQCIDDHDLSMLLACSQLNRWCHRLIRPRLSRIICNMPRYESLIVDYTMSRSRRAIQPFILLDMLRSFPLGECVRSITIRDAMLPLSNTPLRTKGLEDYEIEELEQEMAAEKARFTLYAGYFYHDKALAHVLERLTALEFIEINTGLQELDWIRYQAEHDMSSLLFSQPTLRELVLRGILNIPLDHLERAEQLRHLTLSNYGISIANLTSVVNEGGEGQRQRIYLESLRLKNAKRNVLETIGYFSSPTSLLSIANIELFASDILHQDDVDITAAVLRSVTALKEFRIATWFHHVARETGEEQNDIDLTSIDLSRMFNLHTLAVHLSLRNGIATEIDWLISSLTAMPDMNALKTVTIKVDVGYNSEASGAPDTTYKSVLLKRHAVRWAALADALGSPKFSKLVKVDFVVNSPDDFDKYNPESDWAFSECVPAIVELRNKKIELSARRSAEYTTKMRVAAFPSFTSYYG